MSLAPYHVPLGRILSRMKCVNGDREKTEEILRANNCTPGFFNTVMRMRVSRSWIRRNASWAVVDETHCTSAWKGYGL